MGGIDQIMKVDGLENEGQQCRGRVEQVEERKSGGKL